MLDVDAFQDFRVGLARLRDGDAVAAVELLRQAAKRDPENPYYISYFGLGLGHSEGMWAEAERLCHRAVCRGRRQAQLYLNLAEVYRASGRRQAAADTLSLGLHYMPRDTRLLEAYSKLIMRRAPVFKKLPRGHIANRSCGRVRHFILLRMPRRRWLQVQPSEARA
jgi:tetratricopeptide (TPR) repeat protein